MNAARLFFRRLSSERGVVEIIVAVSLAALLGISAFAIDLGATYVKASKLQGALDSAALAAVKELPASSTGSEAWSSATSQAVKFAALNGAQISESNITPLTASGRISGVTITKTITFDYYFAKALGINTGSLTRSASASIAPVGSVYKAVPLCVTSSALRNAIANGATSNITIKCSSDTSVIGIDYASASGWFGALRFYGSGASDYTNNIIYGYNGKVGVGVVLDMETGNMSGPTLTGFTTRYNQCNDGCTAENHKADCPRVVYIPVVNVLPGKQVKITGFAAFFLLGCGGNGTNSYITASYLENIILRDSSGAASGEDFGVYTTKLTN